MVFRGSSAGGFAALFYSWHVPESVVMAINPQTNLPHSGAVLRYRQMCWPELPESEPLDSVVTTSVLHLYRESVPNQVYYLQNGSDHRHLVGHLGPFLANVQPAGGRRIVLVVDNWGQLGHVWPPTSVLRKVMAAAIHAPVGDNHAIYRWANARRGLPLASLTPAPAPASTQVDPAHARDLVLAKTLTQQARWAGKLGGRPLARGKSPRPPARAASNGRRRPPRPDQPRISPVNPPRDAEGASGAGEGGTRS